MSSSGHDHGVPLGVGTGAGAHRGRLTVTILVVEVIGSAVSGSLALLADAGHVLTDVAGLTLALIAATVARRPASDRRTWGYRRRPTFPAPRLRCSDGSAGRLAPPTRDSDRRYHAEATEIMESLGGLLFPLLILLLFIPIFLSGRKQRRQMQDMQQLQSSLQIGDVVTTTSGLRGTVVDAQYEDTVDLEIADNVVTTWMRAAIKDKVLDAGASEPADEIAPGTDGASLDDPVGSGPSADTPSSPASSATAPSAARTDSVAEPVADTPRDGNGTSRP